MRAMWSEIETVFVEELRRGSRRAWFRFTTLGVPAILLLLLAAVPLIRGIADRDGDGDESSDVGLVDGSDMLVPASVSAFGLRSYPDLDAGVDALLADDVTLLYAVPGDYVSAGVVESFYTGNTVAARFEGRDDDHRVQALLRHALVSNFVEPEAAVRFIAPASFESIIVKDDLSVEEGAKEASSPSDTLSSNIMFLMMISVIAGSMMLLESVSDEKQNRMMEILVTSVSPIGVMAGKVFGLGVLGLIQITVWVLSIGLIGPRILESFPKLDRLVVEPLLLVWMIAFFVAGYFVMSVVMAAIGAASTSVQESRQMAWLALVPALAPMYLRVPIVQDPNSVFARLLSFSPINAPTVMMLRMGAADIAPVEILASLIVTVLGGVALLWCAARIFWAGLLMYGQRMTLQGVITALRQAG